MNKNTKRLIYALLVINSLGSSIKSMDISIKANPNKE
jgi:hypothetical protein